MTHEGVNTKGVNTKGAEQQRPYVVGLTGGIASGKSSVSRYLSERHTIPIIDTDVIARHLVEPGSATLHEIVVHFGREILDEQGQLNRSRLRRIITEDSQQRLWLNALMHPKIYDEVMAQVKQVSASPHPYIMIVIPLLKSDSPYLDLLNAVWVVDCEEERQKQHLIARDQMTELSAQQLIKAQPSRAERLTIATEVIVNDGDTEQLIERINAQHQRLMQLLATHQASL